jgi:hypothetical protein
MGVFGNQMGGFVEFMRKTREKEMQRQAEKEEARIRYEDALRRREVHY